MNTRPASHNPHQLLRMVPFRDYEDYLDWLENQVATPGLSQQQLTLLLPLAVTLTGVALLFALLRMWRIAT
jgi:hypothetical protein